MVNADDIISYHEWRVIGRSAELVQVHLEGKNKPGCLSATGF
jgi:hypothetical protein